MASLGERIKRLRISQGLERAELATRAGVAPSHLWRIEEDHTKPTSVTVGKIADGLGLTIAELHGGITSLPKEEETLLTLFRMVPTERRADIFRYIAPMAAGMETARDFDDAMNLLTASA